MDTLALLFREIFGQLEEELDPTTKTLILDMMHKK